MMLHRFPFLTHDDETWVVYIDKTSFYMPSDDVAPAVKR
jgi:hypothetical protein